MGRRPQRIRRHSEVSWPGCAICGSAGQVETVAELACVMRWPSPSSPAARKRIRRGVFKSVAELESAIIGIPGKPRTRVGPTSAQCARRQWAGLPGGPRIPLVARASTERGRASKQRLLQTRSLRQGPRPLSLVFRSAQQHPGNPEPCWCFALSGGPSLLQRLAGWKVPVYAGYGSAALNENPTSPHHPCPDQLASGKGDGGSQADLGAIPGRGKRLRAQPRRKNKSSC